MRLARTEQIIGANMPSGLLNLTITTHLLFFASAAFAALSTPASAQMQRIGDAPEARNMRLVGHEYPRPLLRA
jgi:hypothetical protein